MLNQQKPLLIVVEGNIGAGKSSLFSSLAPMLTVPCMEEPVEEWKLLPAFYKDPKKYVFALQLEILFSYRELVPDFMKMSGTSGDLLCERCWKTSIEVFSRVHMNAGPRELDVLSFYQDNFCRGPDILFYLDTPAEECLTRIRKRARASEVSVDLGYLQQLEEAYKVWFSTTPIPVYRVNGLQLPQAVLDDFLGILKGIRPHFIK